MKYQDLNRFEQKRCFHTFVMFVNRLRLPYFTIAQLKREFARIVQCNNEREYFKVNRVGEDFALNRELRRTLYSLYGKAMNNEAFIRDMNRDMNNAV